MPSLTFILTAKDPASIDACYQTWVLKAKQDGHKVILLPSDVMMSVQYPDDVLIPGSVLSSDYHKQWEIVNLMATMTPTDFYIFVRSTNYIDVTRLTDLLIPFPSATPLLFGGYGETRVVKETNLIFPFIDGGLILSYAALIKMANPAYLQLWAQWFPPGSNYHTAWDVCLAYRARQLNIPLVLIKSLYPADLRGIIKGTVASRVPEFSISDIVICCLSPEDLKRYHRVIALDPVAYQELTNVWATIPLDIQMAVSMAPLSPIMRFQGSEEEAWALLKVAIDWSYRGAKTLILPEHPSLLKFNDKLGLSIVAELETSQTINNVNIVYPQPDPNLTLVTAFWDLGRDSWGKFKRDKNYYLNNGRRTLSLNNQMIIFVSAEHVPFVAEVRKRHTASTLIIPMELEELPYYSLKDQIETIMTDPAFREGLVAPEVPEVKFAKYDVVIWSKPYLVTQAIQRSTFAGSSHFGWIDFGLGGHHHILKEPLVGSRLLAGRKLNDRFRVMCRSLPQPIDLDIKKFFKAHRNRLIAGFCTGSVATWLRFETLMDQQVKEALSQGVVDCEQSMYALIYLHHPELFDLYHGDWVDVLTKY